MYFHHRCLLCIPRDNINILVTKSPKEETWKYLCILLKYLNTFQVNITKGYSCFFAIIFITNKNWEQHLGLVFTHHGLSLYFGEIGNTRKTMLAYMRMIHLFIPYLCYTWSRCGRRLKGHCDDWMKRLKAARFYLFLARGKSAEAKIKHLLVSRKVFTNNCNSMTKKCCLKVDKWWNWRSFC